MKIFKWISIIFLVFFLFKVFSPSPPQVEEKKELPIVTQKTPISSSPTAATQVNKASHWSYSVTNDKMSGKDYRIAELKSQESLRFDFPYQGTNVPSLRLRKHPKYGQEVLLKIEKGQFQCGISNCSILVKFDDKPPVRFSATEPSDHSTTTLFLSPENKFIDGLKKSKIANIEATFYQQGTIVMTFRTEGLDWK